MKHRIGLALLSLGVLVAGCYPDFDFSPKKAKHSTSASTSTTGTGGASGVGGMGGATGTTDATTSGGGAGGHGGASTTATTSSTTTTTSTSSGGGLPCHGISCNVGEVCCVNKADPLQDHCGNAGTCGAGYSEYTCTFDDDCSGQYCCARDTDSDGKADTMKCGSCTNSSDEFSCEQESDCDFLPGSTCKSFPHINGRPGYNTCQYPF